MALMSSVNSFRNTVDDGLAFSGQIQFLAAAFCGGDFYLNQAVWRAFLAVFGQGSDDARNGGERHAGFFGKPGQ